MTFCRLPALSMLLCLAPAAQAHPGHGDPGLGAGLLHLLTSHAPPLTLFGALAVVVWLFVRDPSFVRRVTRRAQRSDDRSQR